jgi:hypothetical protein
MNCRSLAVLGMTAIIACSRQHANIDAGGEEQCGFAVYNRTEYALDVRLMHDDFGVNTQSLGTLNPGERLSDQEPCSAEIVRIRGVPVPRQAGAPTTFRYVQNSAELDPGSVVEVWLHYP